MILNRRRRQSSGGQHGRSVDRLLEKMSFRRAILCMSVVYAVVRCLSVHSSVRLSVTFVYSVVDMNEHIFNFFTIG